MLFPNVATHVVTHAGRAHRDEFLAVGLLRHAGIITKDTVIERRNVTEDDLTNERIIVLDIGGQYDRDRNNFDHHQWDTAIDCTFSLLARELIIPNSKYTYHEILCDEPWYRASITMDIQGPSALAKQFGLPSGLPPGLLSPIESAGLSYFGRSPVPPLAVELAEITIDTAVSSALRMQERLRELASKARIVTLDDQLSILLWEGDSFGVTRFRDKHTPGVQIAVTRDTRGEGWALYRFDSKSNIDFRKLVNDDNILYAHKDGYLAKTKSLLDLPELKKLIYKAATWPLLTTDEVLV